jgi:hypothetical protein
VSRSEKKAAGECYKELHGREFDGNTVVGAFVDDAFWQALKPVAD